MKVTVNRKDMLEVLKNIQGIVPNSSLPVLQNVKIEVKGNHMKLTTTDLDKSIKCAVQCDTKEDGSTTLPVKRLYSLFKEMTGDEVTIDCDNDVAVIKCKSSRFKVTGLPVTDFPEMDNFESDSESKSCYHLKTDVLKKLFTNVKYAVHSDETRLSLTGVHLDLNETKLISVATDGRRLAFSSLVYNDGEKVNLKFTIPAKTCELICKVIENEIEDCMITYNKGKVLVNFGDMNCVIISKCIDAVYPNYNQVIPCDNDTKITMKREQLITLLSRVTVMSEKDNPSVNLVFTNDKITANCTDKAVGYSEDYIDCTYDGDELKMCFNPEYILDAIKTYSDELITIKCNGSGTPILLIDNDSTFNVVMPLRLT